MTRARAAILAAWLPLLVLRETAGVARAQPAAGETPPPPAATAGQPAQSAPPAPPPPAAPPPPPPPATTAATALPPAPPAPSGAAAAASGALIAGYDLTGPLIDSPDQIQALLQSVARPGSAFIASGPADRIGTPIGTIPRVVQALDSIGYAAQVRALPEGVPAGSRVRLAVDLRAYDRLRYIFVHGNWPIRQDEIQRRIALRPGIPLPPPGPERDATIERERGRVVEFLRGEGYFESNVRIDLATGHAVPAPVDLTITVNRGPSFPLGPITVTGNTAIPTDEITEMFRHSDWRRVWTGPVPFTAKRLREDLARLTKRYRTLGYVGARVSSDFNVAKSVDRNAKNVALGIAINERKRITVTFEGNQRKSSSTLKEELTIFDRGSYDDYEAAASADALQRYYQQQGFFFARVEWRRETMSATEERIVFIINEGPELKVRGIDFVGNRGIGDQELAGVVSVRRYPALGFIGLGAGGYVTGRQMEQDAERIVEHYHARGFPEAKAHADAATSPSLLGMLGATAAAAETVSRDAKAIFVRFTIEEGPRVTIDRVEFKLAGASADTAPGAPALVLPYDRQFLLDSLTVAPGHPYNPAEIRDDTRRLERLFGDAGYPSASVEADPARSGAHLTLTWVIKPGPQTRLGPVFVRGNFVTTPETVLEQIPLSSGDLLTTTSLERGQRNLGFLQLFNNAQPISFPGKEDKRDVVPMVVQVEERYEQYSVIHVGGGISTDQKPPDSSFPVGVYLRAGYENRDFFGHGWNITGQAAYGTSLFRGNLSFLDRRFFGTLFRFDTSLSYLQQATARLGDIHSGGGSIGFSREMYPGVDAGIHYNLRNTTHTESLIRPEGPDALLSTIQLGTTVGSLSFNIEWLRLDNRLVPSRGFRIDAIAEVALPVLSVPLRPLPFPVGDDTFVKVGVHSMTVVPLTSWLSLRHGLRFDNGFPLGGPPLLPKVERFFAGGDTTLRGFKLDRARVEVVGFPIYPGINGVEYQPLGGNLRILQNIDLQFPISPPFYGAVFMDNGVVADSLDGLGASKFRHGVGVSPLLVKLPVGDLSFSWAWPLDPGPGDTKIGVLHVNIGLLF